MSVQKNTDDENGTIDIPQTARPLRYQIYCYHTLALMLAVLEKICKAFHVTPNELLGYPYPADLRFRESLTVISAHFHRSSELIIIYPVCPQCHLPIPREFQNYCCSCSQALSWDEFHVDDDDD